MKLLGILLSLLIVLASACLSNAPAREKTSTTSVSPPSQPIPETTSSPAPPVSHTSFPVPSNATSPKIAQQNVTSTTQTTPKGEDSNQIQGLNLSSVRSWVYWLQNASPEAIAKSGFELVVMDYSRNGSDERAYTREEIEMIKRAGVIPIAYLSIGEAEDYRFYWRDGWKKNPPEWLGPGNPDWPGDYAVKYWEEGWKKIVFEYLDRIIAQGFSGVYLDKVDEYWFWAENGYDESWTAKQMIEFIIQIANYTRSKAGKDFIIIPQNGEWLLDYDNGSLLRTVSGWASEDVFYDGLEPSPWTGEKVPLLDRVVEAGKTVLVVDYVDDGTRSDEDLARILNFIEQARKRGYVPYAALEDRELDRLDVIPGVQPPK
ncbi:MJ1477/TM1410 family putative glycoside hydrolase [Thermococcus thermotolerans]|uniref:MJ1477/TM1410 family putative glycoside hydrolase n=1 Tax=Thermococcus thermotolerans TaxID=2969672 RepID=UPI002157B485|nr:MJ1477/TM1410 family putative glycoside hydrolase [Thermococcus thermotolerans]